MGKAPIARCFMKHGKNMKKPWRGPGGVAHPDLGMRLGSMMWYKDRVGSPCGSPYGEDSWEIYAVWWFLATPLKNMTSSVGGIRNPILMGKYN